MASIRTGWDGRQFFDNCYWGQKPQCVSLKNRPYSATLSMNDVVDAPWLTDAINSVCRIELKPRTF